MEPLLFDSEGNLNIGASENSSQTDFDFYLGKWKIQNRKLKTRLQNCTEWLEFEATDETRSLLNGIGNMNEYRAELNGVPFAGMTLRLFNPKTKLWSLHWADSNAGVLDIPVVGSFEGSIGKFYTKDVWAGKNIIVLFHWDKTNPDVPIWSQAFSTDQGKTWEWNWFMTAHKQVK